MKTKFFNFRWRSRPKGSMLIWTTMLGLILTSVFFMFGMRQRLMIGEERETALRLNTKAYLESVADYLEWGYARPGPKLFTIPKNIDLDGVKGEVSNQTQEIIASVDADTPQSYLFSGNIYMEWNRCIRTNTPESQGDLLVGGVLHKHDLDPAKKCQSGENYDDVVGPLSVTNPFQIKTLNEPFHFRIKGAVDTQLVDNQWHLTLTRELEYGKNVTTQRTF